MPMLRRWVRLEMVVALRELEDRELFGELVEDAKLARVVIATTS